MKVAYVAVLTACIPIAAVAEPVSLTMSPSAAYATPDLIAENIRAECKLPEYQAQAAQGPIESLGVKIGIAEKDDIPQSGKYLQLQIANAISSGNAFIGHRKQIVILVKLFENGKELAKSTLTRSSGGGPGGGFKGSCAVLRRCADSLGKDTAEWLKKQLDLQGSPIAATTAPPVSSPSDSTNPGDKK
jgi:hypothetical protein